ncbi:hypothetical protein KGM_207311 [Danaus plexippus plexippus]|uniref:Tonsoku-like protein n=1 Tax=Danaus plexippus plexippus TaxID=278856 RepID=A0A212ES30_DANPL|nr:hypothetical protein KGM_207311 [Danaus plexippus plexippus]
MMGEVFTLMGEFDKALKYEERHLVVARDLNNLVEEQRAMATLGRIYLLKGQSSTDNGETKNLLTEAEKAFMKSLVLCQKLNGKISEAELMDMRARLLLNIGVVQEHLGYLDKAIDFIQKATSISAKNDLYEVLHKCYTTESLLYSNKKKDFHKALNCLNKALTVAGRLDNEILKKCETLSAKADILCQMSDYQSAKQVLMKAWKLKTPDEEERNNIESNLKVVVKLCETEDKLVSTDPNDYMTLKNLNETMGDGACFVRNYSSAVNYYLKCLDNAVKAGDDGKSLVPIYVSIYQTYKDMGMYQEALEYYYKEYEIIKDVPKEAYTTLYNTAEVLFSAKKPYDDIEKTCFDAREAAKQLNNKKYEIRILKNLLKYQEYYFELDKMEETRSDLLALGDDCDELSDDDQSTGDEPQIGDDVCLADLTDLSDTDEEIAETNKPRRRGKGFAIKKNAKGETQLHVACISGNKALAERLLAQGHPVNARDHAGWLPLHEAAIHGHYDIAKILINNGASVNDRGGSQCDGITPIYDAACNGHLDVVQLLLENGALPSLKTDFGETPLHALQKWRTTTILTKDEEILYTNICNKIHNLLGKTMSDQPRTPVKSIQIESPPSTSKMSYSTKQLDSPALKRRNIIDDLTDDDDYSNTRNQTAFPSDSNTSDDDTHKDKERKKTKRSGVKEYKNAISALRNRSFDLPDVDLRPSKPKPALLRPSEVDDDWLEDDLGVNRTKKRKLSDPMTTLPKRSYNDIKTSIDLLNDIETLPKDSPKKKTRVSDIEISDNSSDSHPCLANVSDKNEPLRNISRELNETRSKDSRDGMRRRWKRQSTLLRAGFQRKKSTDLSSNSSSDNETNKHETTIFSRKTHNENVNYTNCRENPKIVQNMNPNLILPMNVIQPISIMQSKNGKAMQTQILPPAAVKVKIEDKTLLISLKLDKINNLTISWLVEEVKSRYYKLTGVRPIFNLMTSDGAILSEDDPLSLVLSTPELQTCMTTFKASPAEERYLECCDALDISPSEEIQQVVGRSHTTRRLALGPSTLPSTQIRPLFRALTHQTHLTAIMISDNNIEDEGMKYLADCICTLKHLTVLDLSKNKITGEGVKFLANAFEKARNTCQSLENIDLSDNPISDEGFKAIVNLSRHVKLRILKLNDCGITYNIGNEVTKSDMNFDMLETLHISNNCIKQRLVNCLMSLLNFNVLSDLELDNIGCEGSVVGCIAHFMGNAKDLKIRRFSLSDCNLTDEQFKLIFRCLGRARNLQTLTLKNNQITFVTLKKLLQRQPAVPQINLEGCQDIFKYSPDLDLQVWLPAIDFGRCIPIINLTPVCKADEEKESLKLFSKIWLSCFKGRGMIEHGSCGLIKFTATCNNID